MRKDTAAKVIWRLWGDVAVIDAQHDLRVFVDPKDIELATRKAPGACVFAQACRRTFGTTKVLFFRSVAYVELPQPDGTLRVERFILTLGMRDLVSKFDRGERTIPKAGFLLRAPTPGQSFEHVRLKNQKRRHKEKERKDREKLLGTSNQGKERYRDKPLIVDLAVRSGTGAVHFT